MSLCPFMYSVFWYHFVSHSCFFIFWSASCFVICNLVFQVYFTYDIAWFDVWLFFVFNITWCIGYGDYGIYIGGESYSSVYVPPPMYVFPVVLVVYIPTFFIFLFWLYLVYLFLNPHIPQVFLYPNCE